MNPSDLSQSEGTGRSAWRVALRRFLRRLAFCLLAGGILCGLTWILRAPLLRLTAQLWIVNHAVAPADAIVVLGGGIENRPFAAVRLFREGMAPRILLMNVKPEPTTKMGITPTEQELTRRVLLAQGMAETNLLEIGDSVASSYDEALAVRHWLEQSGARRIIIPTDLFHTRRVCWLYGKELAGMGAQVIIVAVPRSEYTATDWWQHEEGQIAFFNEIIKYVYYRLKY